MTRKVSALEFFLLTVFLLLLAYSGWLYFHSIDWEVLERMEKSDIILPLPISSTPSALPK